MAAQGLFPAKVICSTARRARDTIREVAVGMDTTLPVTFDNILYAHDASSYLKVIRASGTDSPLMIVGHNPMLEDAANMLAADSQGDGRRLLAGGFPVCGLAIIEFADGFAGIDTASGQLREFIVPEAS